MRIALGATGIVKVPPTLGGAIESHTYGLANAFGQMGHRVSFVTDTNGTARFGSNVEVVPVNSPLNRFPMRFPLWIGSHAIGGYRVFRGLTDELSSNGNEADVVHLHEEVSAFLYCRLSKRPPVVFTPHNPFPFMGQVDKRAERLVRAAASEVVLQHVLPKCEQVVCLTHQFRTWLVNEMSFPPERVAYVPHAVDHELFSPVSDGLEEFLEAKEITQPYFLHVGRLDLRKGVDRLVQAFSRVGERIQCVLAGTGPLENQIRAAAREEIAARRIRLLGAVSTDDLAKLYAGAQFLVLPSWSECSPLVVLEAMSCGIPVLASDLPVLRDVVQQERTGIRIPPGNLDALQKALCFMSRNPEQCAQWGRNARAYVLGEHTFPTIASRLLEVYQSAAGA